MSRIKYVSVIEDEDGDRQIRLGKVDASGADLRLPTPDNNVEVLDRRTWERVDVFDLPEPMKKSEFKDWWNDHKDDDPLPEPIEDVLEAMGREVTA